MIAVANVVRDNLVQNHQVEPGRIEIVYEFIPTLPQLSGSHEERRQQLGRELGVDLPSDAVLICSMGTLHLRKGADLLVALAHSVFRRNSQSRPVHFLWIGGNPEDVPVFQAEAAQAGLSGQVHFIGQRREPLNLVDACDIFALLSREDPYPLVMLEAASLGKPIVCFDRSGGAIEFVEDDAGIAVPYLDVEAMAEGLSKLIESESLRTRLGENARNKACERHDVSVAAPRDLVNHPVSVSSEQENLVLRRYSGRLVPLYELDMASSGGIGWGPPCVESSQTHGNGTQRVIFPKWLIAQHLPDG